MRSLIVMFGGFVLISCSPSHDVVKNENSVAELEVRPQLTAEQQVELDRQRKLQQEAEAREWEERRLKAELEKKKQERVKRCFNPDLSEKCETYKFEADGTKHTLFVKAQNVPSHDGKAKSLTQTMQVYCFDPGKIDVFFKVQNSKYALNSRQNEVEISFDYGKTQKAYSYIPVKDGALPMSSKVSRAILAEIQSRSGENSPFMQVTYQTTSGFWETFYYDVSVLRESIREIKSRCSL